MLIPKTSFIMAFKSTRKTRRHRIPRQEQSPEKDAFFQPLEPKNPVAVQPKLTIGAPDDKYEREADNVADRVVSNNATAESPAIQAKADSRMERDREIQEKADKGARPQVQRMVQGEEEPLQATSEEEEPVQAMEEEEAVQPMSEEEEPVQAMEEEEEPLQAKAKAAATASPDLAGRLRSRAGKGRKLGGRAKEKMESGFGRDFSGINVHTDAAADEMNRELGARAFARGQDVYFKSGEYNPDTAAGQRLLAHELTHTVQQGGENKKASTDSPKVQRNWDKSTSSPSYQSGTIHIKVTLKFTGAVLNKSGKAGVNTTGLAAAAKNQIEQTYQGKVRKEFMGFKIVYDVKTTASVRSINKLSDFNYGKEHIFVVLDDSHPKVNGTYGHGPFYGSIVYLNEKHIAGMISGADANTIPHEVGHTAGLKHLMEKGEESGPLGRAVKLIHKTMNPDNIMWRGGGHPTYSMADADQKLTDTNSEQLDKVSKNISGGKLNKFGLLNFLDLLKL